MATLTQLRIRLARKLAHNRPDAYELRRGLTLVELSIVILVLGILMVVVYSAIPSKPDTELWRLQITQQARSLPIHLRQYEDQHGRLEAGETLLAIVDRSGGGLDSHSPGGGDDRLALDPWQRPYFICYDEEDRRHICSLGADGEAGGTALDADIYLTASSASWPDWLRGASAREDGLDG